ncbi:MAG: hypothetical protein WCE62_20560 [Polyangiales bacterium]
MDQLMFHPKVGYMALAPAVLMPLLTAGVLLAWWRGWLDRRAWVSVVLMQAAVAGSGLTAMNTGEAEEERVEEIVAEQHIGAHEMAGEAGGRLVYEHVAARAYASPGDAPPKRGLVDEDQDADGDSDE